MPFASEKQRRYMEANHPEITAKWHASGHAYVKGKKKGKVKKSRRGVAAGLGVAATGTAVVAAKKKNEKKGRVKKMMAPVSDDPYFNQRAAQKAFDLVMKMDDDTAEVFTHLVVADYFEETVEKNLGTLQRHLNATIRKQLNDLKKAHLRLVAKGYDRDQAVAYAQTISLIEESLDPVSKAKRPKTPQEQGYVWREQDFKRDPASGQFRTKITHNQTRKLKNSTFRQLTGVDTPKEHKGNPLSDEDKARFQDEYRQLSGFLQAVQQSTGGSGNQSVMLHYRDRNGNPWSKVHHGTKPPADELADPSFRLMGVEARPTTLTAGGAAFGLATALGGGMNADQIGAITDIEAKGGRKFSEAWLASGEDKNSNAKLYGRLAASGEFLQSTQLGPKAVMAGKFAQIVGSAGPQAEAVLGPTARKTAYRYRGTEKAPERPMTRAYGDAVLQGKKYGETSEEEVLRRGAGRGLSSGSLVAAGARTRETRARPTPGTAPAVGQMAAQRETTEERAPSWAERDLGRQVVVAHLRNKMPKKQLYELQLASGNTPPSEGVIINADGQLVTQAIGYGDDHYLPFNLKNLKGLKGGEYIRTRSVGGLTSEDIYTALVMGARQVTVTSRSGTYTMEFEPDFRGGRRHSDKARRMTRRYEQLLDAVQSQQVDRIDIDPEMRQEIEREVKEEMSGPGWRRSDIQDAVLERVDEFKANPYITEKDEERAESIIASASAGAKDDKERAAIRAKVFDDLMDQKETKFRLNSAGYKGALDALQEQFPYYIKKPKWNPPRDEEGQIATERDAGYVEPGRNRPTKAAAGLFGVSSAGKFAGKGGKFSAREADYQGAQHAPSGKPATEEGEDKESTKATSAKDVHAARRQKAAELALEYKASEVGVKIQESARRTVDERDLSDWTEQLAYTPEELRDPVKQGRFKTFVEGYLNDPAVRRKIGVEADQLRREWEQAVGHRDRKPFSRESSATWPKQPATFEGDAYKTGADDREVLKELDRVDSKGKGGLINGIPFSHLSDSEMEAEHRVLVKMQEMLAISPGISLTPADLERENVDLQSPGITGGVMRDPDKITDRLEQLQRARTLVGNLSTEARDKRQSASPPERKEVTHKEPGLASETPKAQAENEAKQMVMVRMALERESEPDPTEVKRVGELAAELDANSELLTTPDALEQFKREHQRDWDIYEAAKIRLRQR